MVCEPRWASNFHVENVDRQLALLSKLGQRLRRRQEHRPWGDNLRRDGGLVGADLGRNRVRLNHPNLSTVEILDGFSWCQLRLFRQTCNCQALGPCAGKLPDQS